MTANPAQEPIKANRQIAINRLLPALSVVQFGGLVWVLFQNDFLVNGRVLLWGGMLLITAAASWWQSLAYGWRASVFILSTLIIGTDFYLSSGPVVWSFIVLCAVPMLAVVFMGMWQGVGFLVTTIGLLFTPVLLPIEQLWGQTQAVSNTGWLIILIIFALVAMGGLLSLDRLLKQGELAESLSTELLETLDVENTRISKRISERTETIKIISAISQKIAPILDEHTLARETINQLQQHKNYYYAQIYLIDQLGQADSLYLAADTHRDGGSFLPHGHRIPKYYGLIGKTLLQKTAVLENDLMSSDHQLQGDPVTDSAAALVVPIVLGDELVGAIDVRQDAKDSFDEDDLFLIESIADQLAISIGNARLYARAQKQALRELLVNSVREQLQTAETVQEALAIASKAISRELDTGTQISIGLQT